MKTICVYHSIDLDGWMSAAIVRLALEDNITNVFEVKGEYDTEKECGLGFKGHNSLYFFGYNYGDPIPNLIEFDKVIMCDISFPKEEMERLMLHENGMNRLTWIDHHISAIKSCEELTIKGLQDTKFAACELTWEYFFPNKAMPEIVRLLGLYDSFRHKGTDEETKVLEFQYGARQVITNYEEAYSNLIYNLKERDFYEILDVDYKESIYKKGEIIYSYLCTEAKQSYKNGFKLSIGKSPHKIVDIVTLPDLEPETLKNAAGTFLPYIFICINKERFNPINFGIDYHKDGYDGAMCWYLGADKMVNISFYNDNGKVNCSNIAKLFGGGGHKGAAGCRMSIDDFKKLIINE